MEHDLTGRVAVVVGGGQMPGEGIGNGRATCIGLARHGATVVAVARHLDRAQATIDMIEQEGGSGWAYEMDVVHRDQCAKLFRDVKEKYGRIDIMVYNVGVTLDFDHATNTATLEAVNRLFDIDLVGCAVHAGMCPNHGEQETGGAIVNVFHCQQTKRDHVNIGYALCFIQGRHEQMGRACSKILCAYGSPYHTGIGARCQRHGLQGLRQLEGGIDKDQATKIHDSAVPLKGGRKTVWETANAITFLVSDEAKFVTGLEFILDGGSTIARGPDPELIKLKMQMAAGKKL